MTDQSTFVIAGTAGTYPLRALAFGPAKARSGNRFDDERARGGAGAQASRDANAKAAPSRFGTTRASDWNGPRLNAAFVAQVLGQVANKDEHFERSVLRAYSGGHARLARVYDSRA